jgi:hypothetical protein
MVVTLAGNMVLTRGSVNYMYIPTLTSQLLPGKDGLKRDQKPGGECSTFD